MKFKNMFYIKGTSKSAEYGLLVCPIALLEFEVSKYPSLFLTRNDVTYEFEINYIERNRRKVDFVPQGHSCDMYLLPMIDDIQPVRREFFQVLCSLDEQQVYANIAQRLQSRISRFAELSRPLLLREKYERDTLGQILAANTSRDLYAIREQIDAQPTDADLKKQLLSILDEKQEFHKG